jgi:xanthine dehydrogenase accessory factor
MNDIYEEIALLRRRGESGVLATVVNSTGSTPRKSGAKMLVRANGQIAGTVGGGALEYKVCQEARKMMETDESQLMHFELTNEDASKEGMLCGGITDVFLEPLRPLPALLIFGGGHISFFLARLGKMLDFHVVIIDDRPEFANKERFPDADETIAEKMSSATTRLNVNGSSYIVIVTRGHQGDTEVLEWAVKMPAAYIGMIGSKSKVHAAYAFLKDKGITQVQLDRVHSPIGLSIGAETPEEISISIMAEIIQVRHQSDEKKPKSSNA